MRYVTLIAKVIVGFLFIISGFVKVVDPIGFGYKLEEYFSTDVLNIPFLMDLALPLATFFAIFEVLLGVFLLLGIWKRFTILSLLLIIVFFSFLTFYSAYFNKVTDCGCFGDAMKLEPWESFFKDVILFFLIIILIIGMKYIKPVFIHKINISLSLLSLIVMGVIAFLGIRYLPIIDFRPYAIGKDLVEGMKSAEELGLEPPIYQTIYTMKNRLTKDVVKITDAEYVSNPKWYQESGPWEMQTDNIKTVKVNDGYVPPIHDFLIDCQGEDKTNEYLAMDKLVLFVIPFVDKLNPDELDDLNLLYADLKTMNITSVSIANNEIKDSLFPNCFMDQTTLKTITRSNPGVVVLKKGVVQGKYPYASFPSAEEISKLF